MENLLKYWCFACSNNFQTQKQIASCSLCQSQAVQLSDGSSNDPSQFPVYQIQSQIQQQQQTPIQAQQNQNQEEDTFYAFFTIRQFDITSDSSPIVTRQIRIIHIIDPNQNGNPFEQIFGQGGLINLLNSLRGQPNLEPASQQEKNNLEQVEKVNECTVCQEENDQRSKGYKLRCGHSFHIDCLEPWLERTNTCPTCRAHI